MPHRKITNEFDLDFPQILAALNSPRAAIVQRYILDNFRDNIGFERYQALEAKAKIKYSKKGKATCDPAAACIRCLVTYNVYDIEDDSLRIAKDFAKDNEYWNILESLHIIELFIRQNQDQPSQSAPHLVTTNFVNLGAIYFNQFNGAHLSMPHAYMDFTGFVNGRLVEANLHGASLANAYLDGADFCKANLTRGILTNAHMDNAKFPETDCRDAIFDFADCSNTDFSTAKLQRASLRKATLYKTIFISADLTDGKMPDTSAKEASFVESNLTRTNLTNVNFQRVALNSAKLIETNAAKAKFTHCHFSFATLKDANFSEATLSKCLFYYSDLSGSNFKGTKFIETDFTHASIEKAQFENAEFNNCTFISRDSLLHDPNAVYSQLTHWHEQIKNAKNQTRRLFRSLILDNILRITADMPLIERQNLYHAINAHPVFEHRRPSIRKEANLTARFFAKHRDDDYDPAHPPVPFLSKTQMKLREGLMPETALVPSGPRRHRFIQM